MSLTFILGFNLRSTCQTSVPLTTLVFTRLPSPASSSWSSGPCPHTSSWERETFIAAQGLRCCAAKFRAVYSGVLDGGTDTENRLSAVEECVCYLGGGWVALLGHNVLLSRQFGRSAGRVTGVMNLTVVLYLLVDTLLILQSHLICGAPAK